VETGKGGTGEESGENQDGEGKTDSTSKKGGQELEGGVQLREKDRMGLGGVVGKLHARLEKNCGAYQSTSPGENALRGGRKDQTGELEAGRK